MSARSPSIAKTVRAGVEARVAGLRVCTVARVEAYDPERQLIDAQPLVLETFEHEGEEHVERLPVIRNVPVCFPGGGGFALLFPVAVGDTVLLVFADRSLDKWKSYGGEQHPREPRRHHLSDAIAVPGLRSFAEPLPDAPGMFDPAPHAKLADVGGVGVYVSRAPGGTEVRLGDANPGDAVALASKVEARLSALEQAFALHTHLTPTGPTSPPVTPPAGFVVPDLPPMPEGFEVPSFDNPAGVGSQVVKAV
jgi:hypothetical protein